jgi:hypothetical protein
VQSNENYPIVRLEDSSRNIFYCRSRDWSATGIDTGRETVEFTLNPAIAPGNYELTVSAGGISSAPFRVIVTAEEVGGHR